MKDHSNRSLPSNRVRPAPLCYSRRPPATQSSRDADRNVALMILSALACTTTFVLVYAGWAF